jgi:predicted enzyme related to lactoylglutathione lyase
MVDMKLELVPLPVDDIDAARTFYADQMGFVLDVDREVAPGVWIVQATPPGSACSVMFGTGVPIFTKAPPGSVHGLHLVVDDIETARAELIGRGVDVAPVEDVGGGVRYAEITDPAGNTLTLQEMAWRRGDAF